MKLGAIYTAGRACAVATRPLCLFLANNFLLAEAAQGLAVVFLVNALALVGVAADPHRRFYALLFGKEPINGLPAYLYFSSLAVLMLVGAVAVSGAAWWFLHSLVLAGVAAVYFLTEKLMDEVLRLRLFEQRFNDWGRINVERSLMQLGALLVVYLALRGQTTAPLMVVALTVGNLLAVWRQVPRGISRAFGTHRLATSHWLLLRSLRSLGQNWILWFITLASATVSYLDRVIALVIDRHSLPVFMLVVMCFSVVQMGVDFFFVSRHRRDFLEGRMSVGAALASRQLLGTIGAAFLAASVASVVVLTTAKNGADFPIAYVVVIALLQLAVALTQIPREIVYWSQAFRRILAIEMVFWMLFFAGTAIGRFFDLPPLVTFVSAVACALVRLTIFLVAARSTPSGRLLDTRTGSV